MLGRRSISGSELSARAASARSQPLVQHAQRLLVGSAPSLQLTVYVPAIDEGELWRMRP